MAALGHFELVEKVGEDASGEVHRATDTRSGAAAFVRIVRGVMPARRERFLRETKRAAHVKHEGLARVLDFGQTPEGDAFVAVEDPAGDRLSARLEGGKKIDGVEAIAIAMQLARTLAAAHDAGVIHRELRPSVVALSGHGEGVKVTIADLALHWSPIAGDPEMAFIAPEHRRPGETVGRRADVFSIGAMLYAMLEGAAPTIGASVEGAMGAVVKRCLAEDPRERYLDTVALDAALRTAIAPRVSSIPPARRSTRPVEVEDAAAASAPASASASASASAPASASASASGPASASGRPSKAPASGAPSSRPPSVRPAGRAPAAPPPRPLGRPLTSRPRWEDTLLDFADGPVPRIVVGAILGFVVARILTAGIVPFVAAIATAIAGYFTWRRSRGPTSP